MASQVNPPRGMRDFLPAEKARRERVLAVIRGSYRSHGFDEIETPVMEDSSRLHAGLGGDNEKLAFGVMKRGLTTEDLHAATEPLDLADLGLRFDLTVPLARFYASHRAELPTVFRAIQIAPVWRAERPQKGRYRQFVQCDIDIIGEAGPIAEVELITATAATLTALGIEGCTIRVNDRRILASFLDSFGMSSEDHAKALITLDKLDKLGPEGVKSELSADWGGLFDALTISDLRGLSAGLNLEGDLDAQWHALQVDEDAGSIGLDWLNREAYARLQEIARAVRAAQPGVRLVFDPSLVRGMGYYTGTIFEVAHPELGYSLGGGGRYDGMIGRFLGTDVPAVGFSLGFERLIDLVDLPDSEAADAVALLHEADVPIEHLARLQSHLVAQGLRVRLERKPRNVAPLLAQLAASGFARVATVNASSTIDTLEFKPLTG